jgi:hypothetical protein
MYPFDFSAMDYDDDPITGMGFEDQRTDADCYYLRVRQADGGMAWAGPLRVAED